MGSLFFERGGAKKKWPHVGGLSGRDVYLLALERFGKLEAVFTKSVPPAAPAP